MIFCTLILKIKSLRCWWNHSHAYVCINKDKSLYSCVHCEHLISLVGSFSTMEFQQSWPDKKWKEIEGE